jgi:gliding-associated putative ABC transporter substrate-binding component GldG
MVNLGSKRLRDILILANGLMLAVLVNLAASFYFFRIDLTEEKRFSVKPQTKALLQQLDDDVYVEVYLEGELNASFRRLRNAIRELLEEFRIYSGNKVRYVFINPHQAISQKARNEFFQELARKGVVPTRVVERQNSQTSEKLIFPGAVVSYGGFETGLNLLKDVSARTADERINPSIEGLEYEFSNAIFKLSNTNRKRIGFVRGHGELDSLQVASFTNALLELYDVFTVDLSRKPSVPVYDVLIVAKPTRPFSEADKFKLDQFVMRGGNVLFLLDKLEATMDSASREDYFAFPYTTNLDDLLFKYGVRINNDLVQDRSAGLYPVVTDQTNGKPQLQLMDWPFFPLINHYADHVVTRNLDAVLMKFSSSIDTVKASRVKKTPLLFTSDFSRKLGAPVPVSINELRKNIKPENFKDQKIPLACLLEGQFTSLYKNRFLPEGVDVSTFRDESLPAKVMVFADGDLARNHINLRTGNPQQLGSDPFTGYTFANEELLLNAVAYLADENGLIKTRNKEVKIRPLNKEKVRLQKGMWQAANLTIPIVLLMFFGIVRFIFRKKKFATFR